MKQAARAVASGHWPLLRFDPTIAPARDESIPAGLAAPAHPLSEYRSREVRFKVVEQTNPGAAAHMLDQAQLALDERYRLYEDLAARDGSRFHPHWQDI